MLLNWCSVRTLRTTGMIMTMANGDDSNWCCWFTWFNFNKCAFLQYINQTIYNSKKNMKISSKIRFPFYLTGGVVHKYYSIFRYYLIIRFMQYIDAENHLITQIPTKQTQIKNRQPLISLRCRKVMKVGGRNVSQNNMRCVALLLPLITM